MKTKSPIEVYFDNPDPYLRGKAGILLRKYIINELIGNFSQTKILDIGCGDGSISLQLLEENNYLTLLDLSQAMLNKAQLNTPSIFKDNVQYIKGDFLSLQSKEQYDVVICLGVLAHISSTSTAIEQLSALTKNNGSCIIQFSNTNNLITKFQIGYQAFRQKYTNPYGYKLNQISLPEIEILLTKTNFSIEKKYVYFSQIPWMGKLPTKFSYLILKTFLQISRNNIFGTEIILQIKKIGS